jgi:hypothetical protein
MNLVFADSNMLAMLLPESTSHFVKYNRRAPNHVKQPMFAPAALFFRNQLAA